MSKKLISCPKRDNPTACHWRIKDIWHERQLLSKTKESYEWQFLWIRFLQFFLINWKQLIFTHNTSWLCFSTLFSSQFLSASPLIQIHLLLSLIRRLTGFYGIISNQSKHNKVEQKLTHWNWAKIKKQNKKRHKK